MATTPSSANVTPQGIALNLAVAGLVTCICLFPTWHMVVALIAILGALGFYWTRLTASPADEKHKQLVAEAIKTLEAKVGNIAFKIGMKGNS